MYNDSFRLKEVFRLIGKPNSKKILFACVPADGHFNPLTGLAKYLQSIGYDVRWYCSAAYAGKLARLQVPHLPFKKALEVTSDTMDELFPERKKANNPVKKLNFDIIHFFIKRGPEYYEDLKNIYASFPFDLVIADCAFTAIPFIKDLMKIPVISVGVFPLTETSKDLAPCGLGKIPAKSFIGKQRQAFSRLLAGKLLFRESGKVMAEVFRSYGIELKNMIIFDALVKKSTLLLQIGTPGFEYYRSDLGKNIRFIGPLLPYSEPGKKSTWFDERMSNYKKIILATQGTVERDVEKLIVPVLEAFKDTDTLVLATTGGSKTIELKSRFPQQNLVIEDFIPFADVMPYADLYISNGGYGGVMLAIENKLPMLVAGVHEGKNEINARIGYFKLGIDLKTETPDQLQIKAAATEVLTNGEYKNNVKKLSAEFDQYAPHTLCAKYVKEILEMPVAKPKAEIRISENWRN